MSDSEVVNPFSSTRLFNSQPSFWKMTSNAISPRPDNERQHAWSGGKKANDFTTPRETDMITPRSARAVFTTPRFSARDIADDFKTPRHGNLLSEIQESELEDSSADILDDAIQCIRHGHNDEIQELLKNGLSSECSDEHGNTLFIIACQNGNKRICKLLLRFGANINAQNDRGNTGLHYCFAYGYGPLGEYLLSKSADDSIENAYSLNCYHGIDDNGAATAPDRNN
eukprot:168610_1